MATRANQARVVNHGKAKTTESRLKVCQNFLPRPLPKLLRKLPRKVNSRQPIQYLNLQRLCAVHRLARLPPLTRPSQNQSSADPVPALNPKIKVYGADFEVTGSSTLSIFNSTLRS